MVTVLICTHNREEITSLNIESLSRQSVVPQIVLVVSDQYETRYYQEEFPQIHVFEYPNKPLGAKWQYGVQQSRTLHADPLIILGSDDILGPKYIEKCNKLVAKGHDFIGLRKWFIHHDNKVYHCEYLANQPLGGGRVYSGRLLYQFDWKLFEPKKKHLDDNGYFQAVKYCEPYIANLELHTYKGLWPTMNEFNPNHPNIKILSVNDEGEGILQGIRS